MSLLSEIIYVHDHRVIMILGNRPVSNVVERLSRFNFNINEAIEKKKILFIDCLTRSVAGSRIKGALFISSPRDLSELQLSIERAFRLLDTQKRRVWLILDGLSTFLIFNGTTRVLQFLIFLTNRLRVLGHNGIIFYYESELEKQLENVIRQYVDAVHEV